MTGAQTDPVNVPYYIRASAILVELASTAFDAYKNQSLDSRFRDAAFQANFLFRKYASIFEAEKSTHLELMELLDSFHTVCHAPSGPYLPAAKCDCRIANKIRTLLAIYEQGSEKPHA